MEECYPSLMPRPAHPPLGLHLNRVARTVSRAFDETLAEAGGSLPVWLVLISLKSRPVASQRELAEAVGIQGATLTHHLDTMESAGLVTRRRDPANRRLHLVELTRPARRSSSGCGTRPRPSTGGCAPGCPKATSVSSKPC